MSHRNINWDLIRVVAVLAVVVGHVTDLGPVLHPELGGYPFVFAPQFGAAALMVVSAYFVCVTVRRGKPLRWLRGRLARLLPAYLAVVVVLYVVGRLVVPSFNGPGIWPWPLWTADDLLANLTLTQGWRPDPVYLDNAHWTLPVQVAAFCAAAVLWHFRRGDARWLATGLVFAPLLVLPLMLLPEAATDVLGVVYTGSGIGRAYLFGVGIALWLWGRRRLPDAWLVLLCAVAVVQYGYSTDHELKSGAAFAVMLALVALAARGPDWAVLERLRRPIAWLAGISYGVYLVHQQLGFVLARVLVDLGVSGWGRLVVVFAAAVVAGWLLTVLVERPAHRLLARRRDVPKATLGTSNVPNATLGTSPAPPEPEPVGGRA
jgi:peptidoglycan/LPS O-acetylase OafA/YrhL